MGHPNVISNCRLQLLMQNFGKRKNYISTDSSSTDSSPLQGLSFGPFSYASSQHIIFPISSTICPFSRLLGAV
jgi:hypothetical protein